MELRKKIEAEIDDTDTKIPSAMGPMGPIPPGLQMGEPGLGRQGEAGDSVEGEPGGSPPNQAVPGKATAA